MEEQTSCVRLRAFPILVVILVDVVVHTSLAAAASFRCPAGQATALLRLKRSFQHPLLPSWRAGTDCCRWEGVSCGAGAASGLVAELDLGGLGLRSHRGGGLDGALFELNSLRRLFLAGNDFRGASLPPSGLERLSELTHLNLSGSGLAGEVPVAVGGLRKLVSLDLSNNGFNGSFPRGIFQLGKLRVLDVSSNSGLSGGLPEFPSGSSLEALELRGTNFSGEIPSSIGNLKHLKILDVSGSNGGFSGGLPASIGDLAFLSFLDLSSSGFQIGELPAAIGRLRSLATLRLRECGVSGAIPASVRNLTLLSELDLSQNNLTGPIALFRKGAFQKLEILQLCCNSLSGSIPGILFSLPRLEFISLMSNNLAGPLQEFSHPSPSLTSVYLNYNQLNGSIPKSFFKLASLQTLDLSRNSLSGAVQLSFFWRLSNLSNLCLSSNKLTVIVDDERISFSSASALLPQLNSLGLACCNMTKIPSILRHVVVGDLDLSCNQIVGSIPRWIWANQSDGVSVFKLNLSRNGFTTMELPLDNASVYYLDLSYNELRGAVPIPMSPQFLDYSNNFFSSIPEDSETQLSSAFFLNLANNTLHGAIPEIICNASSLMLLDLSYNNFSGHVPSCLVDGRLIILKLRQNQFEGTLPDGFHEGCASQTIDLNGNRIEGRLPRSVVNCNDLEVFDVGGNDFVGSFPSWMGGMPKLKILVLRSNGFSGPVGAVLDRGCGDQIGARRCFSSLQIADLASNRFSGGLDPRWFEQLTAMMAAGGGGEEEHDAREALENNLSGKLYRDAVVVTYKGATMTLTRILTAFDVIDLSGNALAGGIPPSIGRLAALRGLNLSRNAMTGPIPAELGALAQLESLDLAANLLDGEIPEALASLRWLAWLNVSGNRLEGRIPQRGQFLTFTDASFQGNAGLCGKPLARPCDAGGSRAGEEASSTEAGDPVYTVVLLLAAGSGFGLGFAMAILFRVARGGRRWRWKEASLALLQGQGSCCSSICRLRYLFL